MDLERSSFIKFIMGSESTPTTSTTIESSRAPPEAETQNHEDINIDRDVIADANKLAKTIHRSADLLLERLLSRLSQFPEYPINSEDDEHLQLEDGEKQDGNGESDTHREEETMMLQRGLTIPVSAIAWLSDQLDALDALQNQTEQIPELELASETGDVDCQQPESNNNNNHDCDLEPWLGTETAKSLRYRLNLLRFLLPRAQLIRLTRKSWLPRSKEDVPSYLCSSSAPKQKLKRWWNKRRRQSSELPNDEDTEAKANGFL